GAWSLLTPRITSSPPAPASPSRPECICGSVTLPQMTKVTVVQLPDPTAEFEAAFAALVEHNRREQPDLVLLPEMPFYPWVGYTNQVDPAAWQAAVDAHEEWLSRLPALGAPVVLGS